MSKKESTKEARRRWSKVDVIHTWHQMNSNTQERKERPHMQDRRQGKESLRDAQLRMRESERNSKLTLMLLTWSIPLV